MDFQQTFVVYYIYPHAYEHERLFHGHTFFCGVNKFLRLFPNTEKRNKHFSDGQTTNGYFGQEITYTKHRKEIQSNVERRCDVRHIMNSIRRRRCRDIFGFDIELIFREWRFLLCRINLYNCIRWL